MTIDRGDGVPGVDQVCRSEWRLVCRTKLEVPEFEPDYRFTLANERTFLACERTALGLLAAAVAVAQLVPELPIPAARHVLGVLLAALAALTAIVGLRRRERVEYAIRRGMPLPRHVTPVYLAVGLIGVGFLMVVLVVGIAGVS